MKVMFPYRSNPCQLPPPESLQYAEPVEAANSSLINPESGSITDTAQEEGSGQTTKETPPRKWEVYEQILRVPYYVVFSRYTNRLRFFQLSGGHYQEQVLNWDHPRIWISELELGLGLWQGEFEGITRQWLRWYDDQGNWVPTDAERATQVEGQLQQVALNLLQQGISLEQVVELTGLSLEQVQKTVNR